MKNLVQQDGDPIRVVAPATKAYGDILFSDQPEADSTITLNGVTWTFKASGASGAESDIGASLDATLDALVTALNASADADIAAATYSSAPATGTTLRISFDTAGTAGNAYTLVASEESNGVVSAPTLLGGGGVESGDGVLVGAALFGIATHDALTGASLEISPRGVYTMPKCPSEAIAAGGVCWWAPVYRTIVAGTGTGYIQVGVAVEAAAETARTVKVLLCTRGATGV